MVAGGLGDLPSPGDEPLWGYAKTIRPRSAQGRPSPSELDVVIAGALVLDPVVGAVKADIGIKDGRIVGVGRAGNAAISDGIELDIGPHTMPISAYGLIATPGAVDSHVHAISPQLLPAALSGGVTTLVTAGFEEPPWAMERTFRALEAWPLNLGLQACARTEDPSALEPLVDAGAIGLKIHEDYGAYPEIIDTALRFADGHDIAVALHTDDAEALAGGRAHHHPSLHARVDRRAEFFEPRDFGGDVVGLDVDMDPAFVVHALDLDADLLRRSLEHDVIAACAGMVRIYRPAQRLRPETRRCADIVHVAVDQYAVDSRTMHVSVS